MENAPHYPSNSANQPPKPDLRAVPEEPKPKVVNRVVTKTTIKKKSLGRAFIEFFGGGDGRSVGEYVIVGIVAPAIQQMLFQIANQGMSAAQRSITNSINRGFTGFNQQQLPQQTQYVNPLRGNYQGHTQYHNMGQQPVQQTPLINQADRRMHNFDGIIIEDVVEANDVVAYLQSLLSDYQVVSVADFYTIVGVRPDPSGVDNQWGWTDLSQTRVINTGRGYRLALPRPIPLTSY